MFSPNWKNIEDSITLAEANWKIFYFEEGFLSFAEEGLPQVSLI